MTTYLTVTPAPTDTEAVRLYTYETVQELLSVSRRTVFDLVAAGDLEALTIGKRARRITARSLAEYVERQKAAS